MRVFLTGATGFVGANVARVLATLGHEVAPFTGNLLDVSLALPQTAFDLGIHLAWYVEPGKYLESEANDQYRDASLTLVQKLNCRRWVIAGTSFEYAASTQPLREDSPTAPRTRYARCKLDLLHTLRQTGIELVWPRLFYLYGPREHSRRLVPTVINALLTGQPAPLTTGNEVRDYLHIEDVAEGLCAVATSKLTGVVNLGSGQPTTIREVATRIADVIGRHDLLQFGVYKPVGGDAPVVLADTTTLRTIWQPRVSLADGLRQTVDWWRQQRA